MGNEKPRKIGVFQEAQTGFEPVRTGVADHCLTAWLLRHVNYFIQFFGGDVDVADRNLTTWLSHHLSNYMFEKQTNDSDGN